MGLFTNFSIGVNTYGEAHRFIVKNKLWGYVLLPGIINLLFLILLFVFGFSLMDSITDYISDWLGLNKEYTGFFKYLMAFLHFFINIILKILLLIFYFAIYKYLILMILSPFLALLSEKVDKVIYNKDYPFNFKQFVHDVIRGIGLVIRNLVIEFLWIILFFFVSYIPVVGLLSPIALFIIAFYFLGFSMIDYSMERKKFSIGQSARFIRKNKGFAIANGGIFYLILMLPVLGILVAPAYSCIAATLGSLKILNQNQTTQTAIHNANR